MISFLNISEIFNTCSFIITIGISTVNETFNQFTSLEVQQGSSSASSAGRIISPEQNYALDFNPLNFLNDIQIRSTSLVNTNWKILHIVGIVFF